MGKAASFKPMAFPDGPWKAPLKASDDLLWHRQSTNPYKDMDQTSWKFFEWKRQKPAVLLGKTALHARVKRMVCQNVGFVATANLPRSFSDTTTIVLAAISAAPIPRTIIAHLFDLHAAWCHINTT
ncbi:hypothetical protein [Agrobacterium vitis]|uniref:hypothetical protein n=1 Tax=Agrobacterium vitis TaxID=373 RepID=UPI0015DB27D9|nr:hypothetical protein [Agrobacterium vitis]